MHVKPHLSLIAKNSFLQSLLLDIMRAGWSRVNHFGFWGEKTNKLGLIYTAAMQNSYTAIV